MKLLLSLLILGLGACASKSEKEIIVVEEPVIEQPRPVYKMNKGELFSNDNVILYPLDEAVAGRRHQFDGYRGVLDNTTAGGYTVFDPSVTVFAVQGRGERPNYLPEYSVPRYAVGYSQEQQSTEQLKAVKAPTSIIPSEEQTLTPRPLRQLISPAPGSISTRAGSRRPPVLTGY